MQFTSLVFLLFFPAVAVLTFLLPLRLRRGWLLAASFVFYTWSKVWYGAFLLLSIGITYGTARWMDRKKDKKAKKRILIVGILLDLGFLLFFKYYNFAADNVGALLGILGMGNPLPVLNVLAPIGISFYTFQSLGYLVDVYRGQTAAEKDIVVYGLFVSFFPQVLAGPISRSTTLLPQMQAAPPRFAPARVRQGLVMVGWGVFLKLVIADRLAVFVNAVFDERPDAAGMVLLAAVLLFAVQMYCDFSSYSTIAMGCAKVLGYTLDQNFDLPYFSRTIPEFWRRWHMTLGSWFKDYLFYPLLRNRRLAALDKKARKVLPKYYAQNLPTVLALLVVWICTGLWHGASWTYAAWGLYHGLLIILGLLAAPQMKNLVARAHVPVQSGWLKTLQVVRTFLLVCIGYVFFRAESIGEAFSIFGRMLQGPGLAAVADGTLLGFGLDAADWAVALCAVALLWVLELCWRRRDLFAWLDERARWQRWGVYLLAILLIVIFGMYGEGYVDKPFLYFQF